MSVLPENVQDAGAAGRPQEQPHEAVSVHGVLAAIRIALRRPRAHPDSQKGQQSEIQLLRVRRVVRSGIRPQGPPEAARPGRAGATRASAGGRGTREFPSRRRSRRRRAPTAVASRRHAFHRRGRY